MRAAGGIEGAVPKAPNRVFGSQNGAKIVKNRGPGAFQKLPAANRLREVPEAKKKPQALALFIASWKEVLKG